MNDNKSTVMNNAAVQQLRKVPGFDPMKLLRKTISVKTGHPVWKLDLRYKRLWFRLACPNGRMLLKPLRISDQLAIIEAQVYFSKDDPVPAASFTSEQRRENIPGGEFLRAAQEDVVNAPSVADRCLRRERRRFLRLRGGCLHPPLQIPR